MLLNTGINHTRSDELSSPQTSNYAGFENFCFPLPITNSQMTILTKRFEQALLYATRLHSQQTRKATGVPYISHLLSVTALVLEAGGNEEEAI